MLILRINIVDIPLNVVMEPLMDLHWRTQMDRFDLYFTYPVISSWVLSCLHLLHDRQGQRPERVLCMCVTLLPELLTPSSFDCHVMSPFHITFKEL